MNLPGSTEGFELVILLNRQLRSMFLVSFFMNWLNFWVQICSENRSTEGLKLAILLNKQQYTFVKFYYIITVLSYEPINNWLKNVFWKSLTIEEAHNFDKTVWLIKVSFFGLCSKMQLIPLQNFIVKTCFIQFLWFFRLKCWFKGQIISIIHF